MNTIKLLLLTLLITSGFYSNKILSKEIKKYSKQDVKIKKYKKKASEKQSKNSTINKTIVFFKQRLRYVDETHRFISTEWVNLNYNVDVYFSNQKYNKKKNRSKISLSSSYFKSESDKQEIAHDIKVRVDFPRVSKKLSIIIERQRDEVLAATSNPASRRRTTKESNHTIGINYYIPFSKFWSTSLDTGLKIIIPLNPFAKFKIYKLIKTSLLDIYMAQKFILYRQEGLKEITQLTFSRPISKYINLAQTNAITWADDPDQDNFKLRNGLSLTQKLRKMRTISYHVGANANLTPKFSYYSYDAAIAYKRPLYKKWIFGNLSLGTTFDKKDNYEMDNFILLKMEMLFI